MSIKIIKGEGFFSCCSVRLFEIISFFNKNGMLPDEVDSSEQFKLYKTEKELNECIDITFNYFNKYSSNLHDIPFKKIVDFHHMYQYFDYIRINLDDVKPFMRKYFELNAEINSIASEIQEKYEINFDNTCVLFYRGNDKNTETYICSYDEILTKAKEILLENPSITFFIQSDETEFIELMLSTFPGRSFCCIDEIRHIPKCIDIVDKKMRSLNPLYSKYFLAITWLMSQCKHVICTTGNCSMWILLYRETLENFHQLGFKWDELQENQST